MLIMKLKLWIYLKIDKDNIPAEFNTDTLHLHFITLSEFKALHRDRKINEILK